MKSKEEAKSYAKKFIESMNILKRPMVSEAEFIFDYPGDKDEAALIWYFIDQEVSDDICKKN